MLLATEQIFPVHLHLYSTYGCGHFFFIFFFYGASCIRLIRLPDLMFTLDRNEQKKKILKSKNTVMLSRKGGGACQLLTTHLAKQRKWY